jgi:sigma-E factor negative regulatory protein RseA
MNEEHPEERHVERDSQLSAMFDGELSAAECELIARRLTKDEALRAQWSRFSMIGAALRAERGVALHDRVAWRVQSAIAQEVTYGEAEAVAGKGAAAVPAIANSRLVRWARFSRPLVGAGIAASVAVMSILWVRNQDSPQSAAPVLASAAAPAAVAPADAATLVAAAQPVASATRVSNGEPASYTTPAQVAPSTGAPPARLANYVVAHSEYSSPLSRRMALLALVGTESAEVPAVAVDTIGNDADAAGSGAGADDAP